MSGARHIAVSETQNKKEASVTQMRYRVAKCRLDARKRERERVEARCATRSFMAQPTRLAINMRFN